MTGTISNKPGDKDQAVTIAAHDLPVQLRTLFSPDNFHAHLSALDFKMPKEKVAKEIAAFCNLAFTRFLMEHSRAVTFENGTPHEKSHKMTWTCTTFRGHTVHLPENFRGRVIVISAKIPEGE